MPVSCPGSGLPSTLPFAVGAAAAAGAAPGAAAPGMERPPAGALHPPLPPGPALPSLRAGRGEGTAQTGRGIRRLKVEKQGLQWFLSVFYF